MTAFISTCSNREGIRDVEAMKASYLTVRTASVSTPLIASMPVILRVYEIYKARSAIYKAMIALTKQISSIDHLLSARGYSEVYWLRSYLQWPMGLTLDQ